MKTIIDVHGRTMYLSDDIYVVRRDYSGAHGKQYANVRMRATFRR